METILLRAAEVAAALGVGRATAYELMASGALPTVRIGRTVRVPRAGLEAWVRRQTIAPWITRTTVATQHDPASRLNLDSATGRASRSRR
jgi:excisionase family DNA binding protein